MPLLASLSGQPVAEVYSHVAELRRRQLIQARSHWRAILPHAVAHRLAKSALENIPLAKLRDEFVACADERLLKSFSRRLGCLHESTAARAIVSSWLAPDGRLGRVSDLDDLGITLLENVAPVDPEGVLRAIGRAAEAGTAQLSSESLLAKLVRLLRSLAYDPACFDEAAGLIARLAANREKSNNVGDAINVFPSLFYLYLSGTHAPARQRADLLRRMARGNEEGERDLALAGLRVMLESSHFSSVLGFEFGSRKRDYGFHPARPEEVRAWYRTAIALCRDFAELKELRSDVRAILARRFRALAQNAGVLDELIEAVQVFASNGGWVEGWAAVKSTARALQAAKHFEEAERLLALADSLQPASAGDLIAVYVLPNDCFALLELDDANASISRELERLEGIRSGIGAQLAGDEATLREHLGQLLGCRSMGVAAVARELGRQVPDPKVMWRLIWEMISGYGDVSQVGSFPAWFLMGLAEREADLAETILDEVLASDRLHPLFVQVQAAVGLGSRAFARLLQAARTPSVPVATFSRLAFGGITTNADGASLRDLLTAVADREGGVEPALEALRMRLYGLRQAGKHAGPHDRETGVALLDRIGFDRWNDRTDRGIAEVIEACLVPGEHDDVAHRVCQRLHDAIANRRTYAWDVLDLVTAFGSVFPRVVLDVFVEGDLDNPNDLNFMAGDRRSAGGGAFGTIDLAVMMEWADEQPGSRFGALARVVRPWASRGAEPLSGDAEEGGALVWSPVAMRLIRRAPHPEHVLRVFGERFHPSSWSGSLAECLTKRLSLLDQLAEDEDERVRVWVSGCLERAPSCLRPCSAPGHGRRVWQKSEMSASIGNLYLAA